MKWRSLLFSLAFIASVAVAAPLPAFSQSAAQNADARKLFVEGRDLQDDGKYADAEKKFREALTKYPKADQADRTAYYLISTLVKLGKAADARTEIEAFRKNYPQSRWKADVDERALATNHYAINTINGTDIYVHSPFSNATEGFTFNAPYFVTSGENTRLRSGNAFVFGGAYSANASLESELLRMILEKDSDRGIEVARERLKADPSDPAVLANLAAISNSSSNQALPFLMSLLGNNAATPNARTQAFFWASRRNGDKDQMAKALMELLGPGGDKSAETAVAEALQRYNANDRRGALDQIAQSQNGDRLAMLERVYRSAAAPAVRADVIRAAGQIQDGKALALLADAAQNDKDLTVRRTAIQALAGRKDADVKTLESLLKAIPKP